MVTEPASRKVMVSPETVAISELEVRYDQGAVEFEVGGVNFKVRLKRVADSAGQVPKVGVPFSTIRRETRETLTKSPLAAWV